jgi:hypothetical protein
LIIQRFLKLKEWKNTGRIVIGGGFRGSRIGELVTGRTSIILKAEKTDVELVPIRNHSDEAGLLGAVHLAPSGWSRHLTPCSRSPPTIGEHETSVVLHNDAVVQGLSEIPFMQDASR